MFAHYYAPDPAATGQILKDQAEGMRNEFDVTVICAVPSYDGEVAPAYQTQKIYFEEMNGVKLVRVRVPAFSKSDKASRIRNIVAYFFAALGAARKTGHQDHVFTISQPPILGGLLGVLGKWMKHAKLVYCIQDFNPEQVMAVNYCTNRLILKAMMMADKFNCRHADLVITVGCDLVDTLKTRFQSERVPRFVMINNWVDEKAVYPLPPEHERVLAFKRRYGLENKFVIMYSGNIGLYYDLENLMKVLKQFRKGYTRRGIYEPGPRTADGREVVFAFVGAGSVWEMLVQYAQAHHFENVVFIPYQAQDELIYSLNAGDVHWCVNAKGMKGVSCSSKAYGIMGVARPMIGVLEEGTEIRRLIEAADCGKCCAPGEYAKIAEIIRWYIENANSDALREMGVNGRKYLEKNLTKDISIQKYIHAIKTL